MKHAASPEFWAAFDALPDQVKASAKKQFQLLKIDPRHPSLQFKKAGRYWSARVTLGYRAAAVIHDERFIWFWIGSHTEYEKVLKS